MLMRNLTVYQRLSLIIAILVVAMVTISGGQIMVLRGTIVEERQVKVLEMVDVAKTVLATFEKRAKAGEMSAEQARRLAFDAIGGMRWGKFDDYIGIYGAGTTDAGVTYVHANPKYINVNRWNFKDSRGRLLIQDVVNEARAGGGYVDYYSPRAAGGAELEKVAYVGAYGDGEQLLAIQAGVYIDDVNTTVYHHAAWVAAGGAVGLLIAGLLALVVGRGLSRPLSALCGVMDQLASENLMVEVPFVERRNEIGRIAHGLEIFKRCLAEAAQLRAEQAEQQQRAEAEKRAALAGMANTIETETGQALEQIRQRTAAMTATADAMSVSAARTGAAAEDCRQGGRAGAGQRPDGGQRRRAARRLDPRDRRPGEPVHRGGRPRRRAPAARPARRSRR